MGEFAFYRRAKKGDLAQLWLNKTRRATGRENGEEIYVDIFRNQDCHKNITRQSEQTTDGCHAYGWKCKKGSTDSLLRVRAPDPPPQENLQVSVAKYYRQKLNKNDDVIVATKCVLPKLIIRFRLVIKFKM